MAAGTDTGNDWIRELPGLSFSDERIMKGPGQECSITLSEQEFLSAAETLSIHKFVLVALFACEGFSETAAFSLFSVFEKKEHILILIREVNGDAASVAGLFPSASWFERECQDGFGIRFDGAFDTRRLFLHECYADEFHPLKKSFRNGPVQVKATIDPDREYLFRIVHGEGVYQVPVGPVHAGIIEPGHFRFSVIGETIFNLEIRMFYKHRGIEKCAEGKLPPDCLGIAEAVSGDESVANATAFCMAVEKIAQIPVPGRAWYLRTILLELERIVSHLNDQAGMLVDIAFPLGASQFSVLREECVRMNALLTGSRFLRGRIRIGGISGDLSTRELAGLVVFLQQFRKRYQIGLKIVLSTTSVIDRFAATGVIKKSLLRPLNITGPVARASGGNVDVRVNHPYGIYDRYTPAVRPLRDGDVLSRFTIKAAEVMDSVNLIERLVSELPGGEICSSAPVKDGHALAMVESARGQNLCWVRIREGRVDRYKVRTASFCNWLAIEHAVQGNIIADFPVINKSLNLSYAGTDLCGKTMVNAITCLFKTKVTGDSPVTDHEVETIGRDLRCEVDRVFGRSLAIRELDTGSDNAAEIEIAALANPYYDAERFGITFVASPRHADVLMVTGAITHNMAIAARKTYEAMPSPKYVVAVGDDACNGGIFRGTYGVMGGADALFPVDLKIAGNPPAPVQILAGLLALMKRAGEKGQDPRP